MSMNLELQAQIKEKDKLIADLKKEVRVVSSQLRIANKELEKAQTHKVVAGRAGPSASAAAAAASGTPHKADHHHPPASARSAGAAAADHHHAAPASAGAAASAVNPSSTAPVASLAATVSAAGAVAEEIKAAAAANAELKREVDKLRAQLKTQEKDLKTKEKSLEEMNAKLEAEMFKHAKLAVELKARPSPHKFVATPGSKDGTAAAAAAAVAAISPAHGAGAGGGGGSAALTQLKKENDLLLKQMARTEKQWQLSVKQLDVERDRRNKVVAEQTALSEQVRRLKQDNYKLALDVRRLGGTASVSVVGVAGAAAATGAPATTAAAGAVTATPPTPGKTLGVTAADTKTAAPATALKRPGTVAAAAPATPAKGAAPGALASPALATRTASGTVVGPAPGATGAGTNLAPATRPASASVAATPSKPSTAPGPLSPPPSNTGATAAAAVAALGTSASAAALTAAGVGASSKASQDDTTHALASFDLFSKRSALQTKFFQYRSLPNQRDVDVLAVSPAAADAAVAAATMEPASPAPSDAKTGAARVRPTINILPVSAIIAKQQQSAPQVPGAAASPGLASVPQSAVSAANAQRHWLELAKHQLYERDKLIHELAHQVKKLSAGLKFSLLARAAAVTGGSPALGGVVGAPVCNDIAHLEMMKSRDDTEKALVASQEALAQLQKVMETERAEMTTTEKNLRQEVLDLSRLLDEAPKAAEVESLTDEVTALQKAVLDYQAKYEEAKRKNKDLKRSAQLGGGGGGGMGMGMGMGGGGGGSGVGMGMSAAMGMGMLGMGLGGGVGGGGGGGDDSFSYAHAMNAAKGKGKGGKNAEAKLSEQIINLQYQIYYGASKKDDEISELKDKLKAAMSQLEVAQAENVEVAKLKHKFNQFKDKEIEDWLFAGDLAEAL